MLASGRRPEKMRNDAKSLTRYSGRNHSKTMQRGQNMKEKKCEGA